MLASFRMLLDIMSPDERRKFWILVVLTFVLSLVEVASIVSILPFLQLLAKPELIETNAWIAWIYDLGGFETRRGFLIACGLLVFFVTVFGLMMKIVGIYAATRFATMRSYSLSGRLLSNYLHQPYEWFLSRHSADLGNVILSEVQKVVSGAMLPAMRMIADVFNVLLLIGVLCLFEPLVALGGAILLGGAYGGLFAAVHKILQRLGATRLKANEVRFHTVQEATGGAKDLKVMSLEDSFIKRFKEAALRMARTETTIQVIGVLPRQAIEALAFGGMIVLILILLIRGDGSIADIVPTLGLIATVGMRLLPALQQLYLRATALRSTQPTLAKVHDDFDQLTHTATASQLGNRRAGRIELTHQLELDNVMFQYPSTGAAALDGLTVSIPARTSIGIVGSSGAGKTTLVDIVLGLLDPTSGALKVDGTVIDQSNKRMWQRSLGYVPQTIFLADTTVMENIAFGRPVEEIDMDRVERAARMAALHEFVMTEMPDGYRTAVGERGVRLSGGQRQRIGIARALYNEPSTLIFDEATSALDTVTEAAIMEAVERLSGQVTVIMIAHRLTTVRACDKIILLRRGMVAAEGSYDDLVATDAEFREMAAGLKDTETSIARADAS